MPDIPPLAGITILDLTRYLAGPFCTQLLGDYGAEVIKVEPVKGARAEMGGYTGTDSYFFMSTNRSKKSVQIDLRQSAGRDVMLRLARPGRRGDRQLSPRSDGGDGARL